MTGKRNYWRFTPEGVNGKCPTCEEETVLVSIAIEYYRCIPCGTDLQQHINGKISYLPHVVSTTKFTELFKDGEKI